MEDRYEVTYYIDRNPYKYGMLFETAYGAIYTARSIFDRHGLATDVIDWSTGEVIAIFEPDNTYIAETVDLEAKMLGIREMR